LRASDSFEGGRFLDERRTRERLQSLADARLVRNFSMAQAAGGLQNYYKLTPMGFEALYGPEAERPSRAFFEEVSPSVVVHTFRLAEVVVEMLVACHAKRVTIENFIRENELIFEAGDRQVQPDCFFRLKVAGCSFNLAFEIDNSMASVDSPATNSIRQKLITYHAYQELMLSQWWHAKKQWERPRFRVIFLTPSVARAYHILSHDAECAGSKTRHLVYAATFDEFLADPDPLGAPLLLDHLGQWQPLIDLHPTAPYVRAPVRLTKALECPLVAC
jgi:hypothetical protein